MKFPFSLLCFYFRGIFLFFHSLSKNCTCLTTAVQKCFFFGISLQFVSSLKITFSFKSLSTNCACLTTGVQKIFREIFLSYNTYQKFPSFLLSPIRKSCPHHRQNISLYHLPYGRNFSTLECLAGE